ncbi:hypothetical protein K378_05170 [Streptomyces sp. Amel2xB2]|uniref:hypothetical protein n=1 Tax=Streptomyces sp. Amel2xB2 TaxID=1305829 RepID=UPI000DBAA46C|nr:hypothetical protein [Streptomyces sp. Amel2xB2]RAJ58290.1 hypothetical protein K378_05170 [Streptomyces sp. Amel2xB2]
MRRGAAVLLAACALTAATAPASSAAAPRPSAGETAGEAAKKAAGKALGERTAAAVRAGDPLPTGVHGPVVTHPVQPPVDYPAGEVCAFASHADFPVDDMTVRTWNDEEDRPVFATASGPLVMVVTNLADGRTVTRDISGSGTMTYLDDGSRILSGGDWGAGFHTADRPVHNKWIVSRGSMSVQISEKDGTTSRRLLDLQGPYEDLCETLGRGGGAGQDAGRDAGQAN